MDIDRIWSEYSNIKNQNQPNARSQELKEKLITEYASLVKIVAGRLCLHLGSHVEYEDLISYGVFGLIDAIDKFIPDKGVKFETYASLRIKGSILDSIRKMDWIPRTMRQKQKQLEMVYSKLEAELERAPNDYELAEMLDWSVIEVRDVISKSSLTSLMSLDDYIEANGDLPVYNSSSANKEDTPEGSLDTKELTAMLAKAIESLNEKERTVVTLYYYEEMTLKEISKVISVTESRVSQIHSESMMKLQKKLGTHKLLLFNN